MSTNDLVSGEAAEGTRNGVGEDSIGGVILGVSRFPCRAR